MALPVLGSRHGNQLPILYQPHNAQYFRQPPLYLHPSISLLQPPIPRTRLHGPRNTIRRLRPPMPKSPHAEPELQRPERPASPPWHRQTREAVSSWKPDTKTSTHGCRTGSFREILEGGGFKEQSAHSWLLHAPEPHWR